jgi:hypothetical protein
MAAQEDVETVRTGYAAFSKDADNGKLTELWDVIYDVQGLDEFWG